MDRKPGYIELTPDECWATGMFEVYSVNLASVLSRLAMAREAELGHEVLTGCLLPSQYLVGSENVSYKAYQRILDEKIAITHSLVTQLTEVAELYNDCQLDDESEAGSMPADSDQTMLRHLRSVD